MNRSLAIAAVAGVAAAALIGGWLYGIGGPSGNGTAESCAPGDLAERLDPLVGGEIAAFQVAERAVDLSGLAFRGPDGAEMSLADFSGRVALLNLWATWCAPCREEMPALDRLAGALAGEDFALVPVSIDTGDAEKPKAFLASLGTVNLPLYSDPTTDIFQEMKRRSLALGLPVTALVDRKGCLVGHINGPAVWDSDEAQELVTTAIEATAQD